jgi:4'-phosphopantetheinyl transferase
MEKVDIFILKTNDINDNYDYLYNNLSIEDKKEVDKYKINKDKLLHLGSIYLKRKYIKGDIYNNEYGKPLNDNISFNISHSNEYVIIGISKTNIGIDIEYIKDIKERNKGLILKLSYKFDEFEKDFGALLNRKLILDYFFTKYTNEDFGENFSDDKNRIYSLDSFIFKEKGNNVKIYFLYLLLDIYNVNINNF